MFLSIRWTAFSFLVGVLAMGAMPVRQLSAEEGDGVCLYDAMEAEKVLVRFIAVNGGKSNVIITNLTDEPLDIRLPDAVVAVPAVIANGESTHGKRGLSESLKVETQAVGGAFLMNGRNFKSAADGNSALLRLAPKKTRRLTATTVGLEFGKAVPSARVEYKLVRPESKVDDPRLMELFRQLGSNQVHPFIGQAVAWHLTDEMSWSDLSHGGANSKTISNYLTSSNDNECGFCPLTLNAASTWVNQYDSLNSKSSVENK
ncbi:hypothetical protein [Stieleria varia]|uniref:Uncharacterized protein n=1 Tax=Stieleria varia TaxID=2528005 RepID=A0A5C6ATM1_9BACT|nr:hypothetical protein [Stieleria varia]TWU02928.1 hypothetical protein Pla52n_40160 [Stieleria varia]